MADTDNVYRCASYIGSFPVSNSDLNDRTIKIQKELEEMRVFERSKCVSICISIRGIKICSENHSTVYMAHALRRISYATCDAAHKQVAFVAREPTTEASLQYCHVFVAETPAKAEELNRIVGDAFQLAYLWQRLGKQQPKGTAPTLGTDRIPRLCDLHTQWPSPVRSNAPMRSVLSVLALPPPPAYPPSCSTHPDTKPPEAAESGCSQSAAPINSGHHTSIAYLTDASPKNGSQHWNTPDELEERLQRISTPQVIEGTFRRRNFLRNECVEKRLSGISDVQILGGSTRQPKRRQGLGWTGLFASTRHSAFIPTSQAVKEIEPPPLSELLNAQKSPHKPQIFVDLRTFAGGSPVVALKERLDAQAVANAKASAFAEAAAVLAAAKQASACSSANSQDSVTTVPNGIGAKIKPDAYPPSTSTSPSSTTSTHSEPSPVTYLPSGSAQSPPTPPLRIHSLRRSEGLVSSSAPQKHVVSNPIPGRFCTPSTCSDSSTNVRTVMAPTNCDSSMRSSQAVVSNGYPHHRRKVQVSELNEAPFQLIRAFEPNTISSTKSSETPRSLHREDVHQSSVPVADQRSRLAIATKSRRSLCPTTFMSQGHQQSIFVIADEPSCKPHRADKSTRPREHTIPISSQTPLHVTIAHSPGCETSATSVMSAFPSAGIASLPGWFVVPSGRAVGIGPGVMTSSTISAETPTPTATPTPTPTQTPQPIQRLSSGDTPPCWSGSQDEWLALRQAPWFQGLLPRELAFELLAQKEVGSFLVRNSATHPDCCALSVRVPTQDNSSGITHYLIQHTPRGVRLKGLDKEWPSLHALITHLTVIPEMLPCTLRLSPYTSNPIFTRADERPFATRCRRSDLERPANGSGLEDHQPEHCNLFPTNIHKVHAVVTLPSQITPTTSVSVSHQSSTSSHDSHELHLDGQSHPVRLDQSRSNSFPAYTGSGASHNQVNQWRSNSLGNDRITQPSNHTDVATTEANTYNASLTEMSNKGFKDTFLAGSHNIHDVSETTDGDDYEEDEEYQRLSDFSSILADLKLAS